MGLSSRCALLAAACVLATSGSASAADACGEVVTLKTHGGSATSYSLAMPPKPAAQVSPVLVLLPGSSGEVALDSDGCATRLKGNWLVRSRDLFRQAGFATALLDVPSD